MKYIAILGALLLVGCGITAEQRNADAQVSLGVMYRELHSSEMTKRITEAQFGPIPPTSR